MRQGQVWKVGEQICWYKMCWDPQVEIPASGWKRSQSSRNCGGCDTHLLVSIKMPCHLALWSQESENNGGFSSPI